MVKRPTRRSFLKQTALAGGAAVYSGLFPPSSRASSPTRQIALVDGGVTAVPVDVGDRTQFMLDELFVERGENVRLEINPPRKAGVVLRPERPWEEYRIVPQKVLLDGELYKMWYGCVATYTAKSKQIDCPRCKLTQDGRNVVCKRCGWPTIGVDEIQQNVMGFAYAESKDGIHWERPELGLREFRGSKKNNLVPGLSGVSVPAVNPLGPDDERFMCIMEHQRKLWIATSPDGVRWMRKPKPALPFAADTNNQVIYDPKLKKYVALLRGFPGRRVTVRCEFDSLNQAPLPYKDTGKEGYITDQMEIVMDRDDRDPPISFDMNSISATLYAPGVYLGCVGLYRHYPGGLDRKGRETHRYFAQGNDGTFENQLAVSRDGRRWLRPDRRPYIPLGHWGGPEGGIIIVAPGIVPSGDELFQYYSGHRTTHGIFTPGYDRHVASIFRTVQEKDRFVGLATDHRGGKFTTPPLSHAGRALELNIQCTGLGETFVEIQDGGGKPIPGFTRADCDPVDLNQLRHTVSWRGNSDVSKLAGKPIRLAFSMRASKLYTFRFAGDY